MTEELKEGNYTVRGITENAELIQLLNSLVGETVYIDRANDGSVRFNVIRGSRGND